METTFEKIVRRTGKKLISCKCQLCKSQCMQPCKGTPEDIKKLIDAGYGDRLMQVNVFGIDIITPKYDEDKKSCTFFTNGLCELHDLELKPTEGKLSHHSTSLMNFNPKKSLTVAVLKEWAPVKKHRI